ncbi:DUF934 domain-containing protein [Celeribacter neptunius]|uniref:Oxidoreductase n=1 Tax=Celeribacter neptunius TaxID=588602 RepID=A0A1I3M2X4_9RHOB|nr:DUF934 domain-containing protein [Celeribacter neptunius]SFI91342.1 protein of unknown function [Celeribacter neptunius]
MSVIVQDSGFVADDFDETVNGDWCVLTAETDVTTLEQYLGEPAIRVDFVSFSDGRGFTLARLLRLAGFAGRLRACGPVIADQYAMARRAGFDEVEIPDDLAARQPEAQWLARADWRAHDYQTRLRKTA